MVSIESLAFFSFWKPSPFTTVQNNQTMEGTMTKASLLHSWDEILSLQDCSLSLSHCWTLTFARPAQWTRSCSNPFLSAECVRVARIIISVFGNDNNTVPTVCLFFKICHFGAPFHLVAPTCTTQRKTCLSIWDVYDCSS